MNIYNITQTDTISEIVQKLPLNGWEDFFEEVRDEINQISQVLEKKENEGLILIPLKWQIFRPFMYCSLSDIKVVIFDEEPYQGILSDGTTIANGLAFSTDGSEIPNPLRNIFSELKKVLGDNFEFPKYGDLTPWAKQGVLLLNKSLTGFKDKKIKPSDNILWMGFMTILINKIIEVNKNIIFVLWGEPLQDCFKFINSKFTTIKGNNVRKGFSEENNIAEININLYKKGIEIIDWKI
jgi:uracil-DNA glycosylase